jgi:hypothetical protein
MARVLLALGTLALGPDGSEHLLGRGPEALGAQLVSSGPGSATPPYRARAPHGESSGIREIPDGELFELL